MEYPILDIIKSKAASFNGDEGKPITKLASEIGKTSAWIYTIKSINDLTLDNILKISKALAFDFLSDYNHWLIEHDKPAISAWQEDAGSFTRKAKKIRVQFSLRGDPNDIGLNFTTIMKTLKKECDNYGIEVE
jgi:hypothetical protein